MLVDVSSLNRSQLLMLVLYIDSAGIKTAARTLYPEYRVGRARYVVGLKGYALNKAESHSRMGNGTEEWRMYLQLAVIEWTRLPYRAHFIEEDMNDVRESWQSK